MSAIPPGWLGSIAQTQGAQQRAAEAKSKEAVSEADAARAASFKDKLAEVIDTDDRDTQVFADGEGDGSQGRASPEDATSEHDPAPPPDDDDQHQLDIEA